MKLKKFDFSNGDPYSTLLGDDGFPMMYPSLFVMIFHRNAGDEFRTIGKHLEHIKYLYEICNFIGVNIEERAKTGEHLTKNEMQSLFKWSLRTVEAFREHVVRNKSQNVVELNPQKNKLETARGNIIVDDEANISSDTSYNRMTTFANYIGWLEGYLFPSKTSHTETALKGMRPKKLSASRNATDTDDSAKLVLDKLEKGESFEDTLSAPPSNKYKSLEKIQIIRLMDVARPNSSDNPWEDEGVRYRNELIFRMFHSLGIRKSEMARVRLDDIKKCNKTGRKILVVSKRKDRKYDKRKDRPSAKTLGRDLPLTKELLDMIAEYITNHRSKVSGVGSCPYLFITHKPTHTGILPLSLSSINKMFDKMTQLLWGEKIHPHRLRHTWNDDYTDMVDELIKSGQITFEQAESDRKKNMGWRDDSVMVKLYGKRKEDERAFTTGMELQEKGITEINSTVGQYDEDISW